MGNERFLGNMIAERVNKLYKKAEKGEVKLSWPLIDPNKIDVNKITNYLGSEEFLGWAGYMWLEMRKKK